MVESENSYKNLLEEIKNHDIILCAIPLNNNVHPCVSKVCAVFIKDIISNKTYNISFQHDDSYFKMDDKKFINDINNLSNKKWVINKKSFIQMMPLKDLKDINLLIYLSHCKTFNLENYETIAHKFIKRLSKLNNCIPILKHQETFDLLCNSLLPYFELSLYNDGYEKENNIVIETLAELELNGICVSPNDFNNYFNNADVYNNNLVYSQYNIYTPTGRPSNNFQNVNYAALNKNNGCRSCFVSRFGKNDGKMILIDYNAFHPTIIGQLTNFTTFGEKDVYQYLGEVFFNRNNLSEYDVEESKKITFKQLYGGVEKKYEHIKYFSNLKFFINNNWEFFKKNGYIETPIFKRRINSLHINNPWPNKILNYILQATESEIAISILKDVNSYLKNKKTKAVLYIYDSILFDFCKEDGLQTLQDIINIMTCNKKFPIKVFSGDNYQFLNQIYPKL
jgi:hypothetical protein